MKATKIKLILTLFTSTCLFALNAIEPDLTPEVKKNFDWVITGMFKGPEVFYGKNISLLNSNNPNDKIFYVRHIFDLNLDLAYGKKTYQTDVAKLYFNARNKSIWGNANSIAPTTESETKGLNAVGRPHKHNIPRHIFWIRELWLRLELGPLLSLNLLNDHTLTFGAFPFELGRGIALGDAYAIAPEILGFYTDNNVDQFAFGGKLSGEIVPSNLTYDFYTAILQNKSSSLSDTGEKSFGQIYNKLKTPARGFGLINFLVAGRFNWTVFDNTRFGKLKFEPYALYNNDPEQRVEFTGDAQSRLGTVGLACEYRGDRCEFGFDYAQNLGEQIVKGVDRNQVIQENRNGFVTEVNSNVRVGGPTPPNPTALFIPNSDSQTIINRSRDDEIHNINKQNQNGQPIGFSTTPGNEGELFNDLRRFRDGYTNFYRGRMFVTDASIWIYRKDLQFAVTAGFASGDSNPHDEVKDGTYDGFIPLQELYSGKRVRSAFLFGGAGKLKRPLSTPDPDDVGPISKFSAVLNGFTNIVFTGAGFIWKPQDCRKPINFNPNLLAFWQQTPSRKFDFVTKRDLYENARTFLGIEANIFFYVYPLKDLKLFLVTSVFFPGAHYHDIRGKPLDREQDRALDVLDRTGFVQDILPNIGTDIAFTFNMGLEFRF